MEFPVWDVGIGYGVLMALFGVVHVFVSHFAIGGGLALVLAERRARRAGDVAVLAHVRRLSAFFAPTTLVVGAPGMFRALGAAEPGAADAGAGAVDPASGALGAESAGPAAGAVPAGIVPTGLRLLATPVPAFAPR